MDGWIHHLFSFTCPEKNDVSNLKSVFKESQELVRILLSSYYLFIQDYFVVFPLKKTSINRKNVFPPFRAKSKHAFQGVQFEPKTAEIHDPDCSASLAQFANANANTHYLWRHRNAAHCCHIWPSLTQNMRLRKTKTVLEDVIPH